VKADGVLAEVLGDLNMDASASDDSEQYAVLDPSSLTAGKTYDLRVYIANGASKKRQVSLSFAGDGRTLVTTGDFNEDDATTSPGKFADANQVYYINYRFKWDGATTPGFTVTQKTGSVPFVLYALTNQEVPASPEVAEAQKSEAPAPTPAPPVIAEAAVNDTSAAEVTVTTPVPTPEVAETETKVTKTETETETTVTVTENSTAEIATPEPAPVSTETVVSETKAKEIAPVVDDRIEHAPKGWKKSRRAPEVHQKVAAEETKPVYRESVRSTSSHEKSSVIEAGTTKKPAREVTAVKKSDKSDRSDKTCEKSDNIVHLKDPSTFIKPGSPVRHNIHHCHTVYYKSHVPENVTVHPGSHFVVVGEDGAVEPHHKKTWYVSKE
jgi:hypothetical protein